LALNAIPPSGVNPIIVASSVKLFPNPTNGDATLTVALKKSETFVISILDINGNVVAPRIEKTLQAGSQEITLNTATLANGNYFVTIASGAETMRMKLVVLH